MNNIQPPIKSNWTFAEKFAFRFCFVFFLLYIFPFPLYALPFFNELFSLNQKFAGWHSALLNSYSNIWHGIVPWTGKHILHLSYDIVTFTNGSGDTTYDYVLLLIYINISLLAAIIWTLFDRKRNEYISALYWLRVLVRYYLAVVLFSYGFFKVFHVQMPSPFLFQLVEPFGDKSPMGLAWSFVGYSKAYSAFTGWGEIISGALLFFRRTTTLGALFSMVVIGNIVAINFCYDVPVKLYSSTLFFMSFFLAAPDLKRLLNVFILNKTTQPVIFQNFVHKRWQQITVRCYKALFIIYAFYSSISASLNGQREYGDKRKLPPLHGIYNTTVFIRNKDTIPPLTTDTTRWKQLIVDFDKNVQIKFMNDKLQTYNFSVDTLQHQVSLNSYDNTIGKSLLSYKIDGSWLTLTGDLFDDSVYIRLNKYDPQSFNLMNRGFHWINEHPFHK
ncbi:MAG TPA: hypothetical protein VFI33_09345 [Puia sp.]|nr:hypothetical protein [Puia sp.]